MNASRRAARLETAVAEESADLLAYFLRRIDVAHDAADLLSETFLIAWRRLGRMPDEDAAVRPWLFVIARHALLHHYRSGARRRAAADRLRERIRVDATTAFTESPATEALHVALGGLDPRDQEIIGLVHWEGFTLAEVGRTLRMKEGTVRSRYHRARAALRARLADLGLESMTESRGTESREG